MRDVYRTWSVGRVRKTLHVRMWWWLNPFRSIWWRLGNRRSFANTTSFRWVGRRDNGRCYCPTGYTTEVYLSFFGVGVWVWLSRDDTRIRPCSCDKIVWLMIPDSYPDTIAEYGLAKLQAEYPDVHPLYPETRLCKPVSPASPSASPTGPATAASC